MTTAEIWMMRALVMFAATIVVFAFFAVARSYFAKKVQGHVYCIFWTREGNIYGKLIPIRENGVIILPARKKQRPKLFMISDMTTGTWDYPLGWPAWVQSKVKVTIYDEDCWEPLLNRTGKLLLDPQRLNNLYNQAWSAIGVEKGSDELKELAERRSAKTARAGGLSTFAWIIIAAVIIGVVGLVYYVVQNLDTLKAAAGV